MRYKEFHQQIASSVVKIPFAAWFLPKIHALTPFAAALCVLIFALSEKSFKKNRFFVAKNHIF
ncbi:MAG: hypothetical protein J6M30_00480 [Bacteroidales bacterium]|nr:hypothetical protein [Bacteroidales bacterium]